jgi:hypothetical protein
MYLVYYEDEGVVRAIGHECGNHSNELVEEKEAFERRQRQAGARQFLRTHLAGVPKLVTALNNLPDRLCEAKRLHQNLGGSSAIAKHLRRISNQENSELTVTVGTITSRFGFLTGHAMFRREFDPGKMLNDLLRIANNLPCVDTEPIALMLRESQQHQLSPQERGPLLFDIWEREYGNHAEYQQHAQSIYKIHSEGRKLADDLESVRRFFSVELFERLHSWGQHPDNLFKLAATHTNGKFSLIHNERQIIFKPDLALLDFKGQWRALNDRSLLQRYSVIFNPKRDLATRSRRVSSAGAPCPQHDHCVFRRSHTAAGGRGSRASSSSRALTSSRENPG